MTEIFLVDLVSLVYLVKEMNEKNHIDQTIEIDGFGMECLGKHSMFDGLA